MRETPLEELPLIRDLSPDERAELEEALEPASFEVGENIFTEGGPEESLYILTEGTVEVSKQVLPRRTQRLATVRAPTVVGEMGLLTEPKAAATVTAATPVEAYSIPRDRFLKMIEDGSPAAYKLVYEIGRTLAERMEKTDRAIAEIIENMERAGPGEVRDFEIFQDSLIHEWGF